MTFFEIPQELESQIIQLLNASLQGTSTMPFEQRIAEALESQATLVAQVELDNEVLDMVDEQHGMIVKKQVEVENLGIGEFSLKTVPMMLQAILVVRVV